MERWPNFFIVGATKAGTTSLYNYLTRVDDVYMSPNKEPRYFMPKFKDSYILQVANTQDYLALFADAGNAVAIGEATTGYLANEYARERIYEQCPNARIIMSLRDPIERTFSHYLMKSRSGRTTAALREEYQNAISGKSKDHVILKYADKVKAYWDLFGKENVQVLIFEEWVRAPKEATQEMLKFLGIQDAMVDELDTEKLHNPYRTPRSQVAAKVYGSSTLRALARVIPQPARLVRELFLMKDTKKPELDIKDREDLKAFYWDDVCELKELLDKKLPWKNFTTMDTETPTSTL